MRLRDKRIPCRICGGQYKRLTAGHLKNHGLTRAEYEQQYGPVCLVDAVTAQRVELLPASEQAQRPILPTLPEIRFVMFRVHLEGSTGAIYSSPNSG